MRAGELPIARNTGLLAGALALNSAMLQLAAAVASLTLVMVLDVEGLLGLGPAIVLSSGALAALPAGRAMDRFGRVPVLMAGFAIGAAGCGLAALGTGARSPPAVLLGLIGVGAASATALLARTAAGDMYPPERRARGIALVLFGAVFGAILGPAVFGPLLAGREFDADALVPLWLAAGGFMLLGVPVVAAVRPDPKRIAELLRHQDDAATATTAAPLRELLGRPGVIPALLAAQASFAVMVGVMTLTGAVVVEHQHHEAHHVFTIIGAHVMGMYALVIVVGDVIDRIGRRPALSGGLLLMALSVISLLWIDSVAATAVALFGLGLGWNLSFVAATAELADRTAPWERGKLLGFNDLLSGLTGAGLALIGGLALTALGVAALAIGATALVVAPALWLLRTTRSGGTVVAGTPPEALRE
jgi:MFS family permease